jgi:hypothetical protein
VKNSKKFNSWARIPRVITTRMNKQEKITIIFIAFPPLSFNNMKLEKKPSIFRFDSNKKTQSNMKIV